ncbi:hypothetical protein CYLTODRAFT_423977 [Cylindrobasidium torrendii FP15055 ss-10]|uniref:Uncharacterized protein n=1 Tax=Cylindrobasidium torrendii FP15055 ss-10 TaxID=1314674 RepID=A0A0D7B5R8_9AGAR|nr:hypothetical protein CYLTODRAFT_423977 [Cylindrobasidium torrendii FP15055 ss-10]
MRTAFANFVAQYYPRIQHDNPLDGRRMWLLRAANLFWESNPAKPVTGAGDEADNEVSAEDEDPIDQVIDNVAGGVVLRTDFSNEEAWQAFLARLKVAESEHKENNGVPDAAAQAAAAGEDEDAEEEEEESVLVKVIDASVPEERGLFDGISNLRALRLFNDVDIRPTQPVPEGQKRVSTPHRLVDRGGWQEVYSGITLWIYDERSNTDQCLRLVSGEGDTYGTATGDSWRAQVTHVYDLQFNMTFFGMQINFGGLDRWDTSERNRNLHEADALI